jgi:hypothetical protein
MAGPADGSLGLYLYVVLVGNAMQAVGSPEGIRQARFSQT